jgi:SOS response regulatory protein OraA/RecX
VNDAKLCHALFAKYAQDKKCGSRLAVSKILQRGLPQALVAEIRPEYDFADEAEQALALAQKRYSRAGRPNSAELGKIARYLNSRGFSSASINKTLQELKHLEILAAEEED